MSLLDTLAATRQNIAAPLGSADAGKGGGSVSEPSNTRAGAILREAAAIVDGPRNATHGDKLPSFSAIAALWNAYLLSRPRQDLDISASDVAAMMVLLKFARSAHGQHIADHGLDAAGYAAIWGELREGERPTPTRFPQVIEP